MAIEVGTVVDNKDPEGLGRVRVRIYGTNSGGKSVNNDSLPWADVVGSNEFGLVGGVGISSVLHCGTDVWVMYQTSNGVDNKDKPVVIGTCHKKVEKREDGYTDPEKKFPPEDSIGHSAYSKSLDGDEYLNAQNIHTASGHDILISDIGGNERIKILHKTGSYIEFDKDGNINIYAKKDITLKAEQNIAMESIGANITHKASSGDITNSSQNFTTSADSGASINASDVNVKGDSCNIQGGGGDAVISGISLTKHCHPECHSGTTNPPC